jgi:hypothetical protein
MKKPPKPKNPATPPAEPGVLQSAVAAHLDVSQARVAQFVKEGVFEKTTDGKLDLTGCRIAYIRWLRDETRKSSNSAAASRLQDARAAEIELRTAEKHKLFEARGHAAAAEAVDDVLGPLRPDLLAIPARLTADIALRRKFEDEIDNAFAAMGERANALAAKVAAGAPADAGNRKPSRRAKTG